MADKSKSIKNATDKELDDLIIRLRRESEAQDLIGSLKRKSMPINSFGNSVSYDRPEVSTEEAIENLYHDGADKVLSHFGIPGMKWGKRSSGGNKPGKKKKKLPIADDYTAAREAKAKGYKHLTNQELKSLNTRLQLEKSLRELKVSDYSKGLDAVKAVTAAGTTLAALYALGSTPFGQAVKKAVTGAVTQKV